MEVILEQTVCCFDVKNVHRISYFLLFSIGGWILITSLNNMCKIDYRVFSDFYVAIVETLNTIVASKRVFNLHE